MEGATTTGPAPGTATDEPPGQVTNGVELLAPIRLAYLPELCPACRDRLVAGFDARAGEPRCHRCAGGEDAA